MVEPGEDDKVAKARTLVRDGGLSWARAAAVIGFGLPGSTDPGNALRMAVGRADRRAAAARMAEQARQLPSTLPPVDAPPSSAVPGSDLPPDMPRPEVAPEAAPTAAVGPDDPDGEGEREPTPGLAVDPGPVPDDVQTVRPGASDYWAETWPGIWGSDELGAERTTPVLESPAPLVPAPAPAAQQLDPLREALAAVDSRIKELAARVEILGGLETRLAALEGKQVTDFAPQITELESRLAELNRLIQEPREDVGNLALRAGRPEQTNDTVLAKVNGLANDGENLARRFEAADAALRRLINVHNDYARAYDSAMSTLDSRLGELEASVGELGGWRSRVDVFLTQLSAPVRGKEKRR